MLNKKRLRQIPLFRGVDQQHGPIGAARFATAPRHRQLHPDASAVGNLDVEAVGGVTAAGQYVQESFAGFLHAGGNGVLHHAVFERAFRLAQPAQAVDHRRVHGERHVAYSTVQSFTTTGPVPVGQTTWGRIKSLYR